MSDFPQVRLKPRKAGPFFGRHPWVLSSAIDRTDGEVEAGSIVDVCAENGDFIARGLYNPNSRIRVRLLTWQASESLDDAWWHARLSKAIELRQQLGLIGTESACRLVNSEADGLSGLIVDRFGEYAVVQPTSYGIWQRLEAIVDALQSVLPSSGTLMHMDPQANKREGIEAVLEKSWGTSPPGPIEIREHGLRYQIDLRQAQKTGFYLDQRLNRLVASRYLEGRSVADICCYSGGFSLCADKLGSARQVIGVDTSSTAIEIAKRHAELNGCENCQFEVSDCFKWLDAAVDRGATFGAVILDPPKFASGRKGIAAAMRAYHRLNLQAVKLLEPGGILVTCSCTGSIHREEFIDVLHGVAVRAKRTIQILENRGAAPDHPIGTHCRENDYLKCMICRVL